MEVIPPKIPIPSGEMNLVVNKTVGCLLFCVFGAMGFFYSLCQRNWNSAAWCILLELACTVLLQFIRCYVRTELHLKFSSTFFRVMKCVAAAMTALSLAAFVAYIALGANNKEEFTVISHYSAAPIAFLAAFWYLILFFDCRKYERLLE